MRRPSIIDMNYRMVDGEAVISETREKRMSRYDLQREIQQMTQEQSRIRDQMLELKKQHEQLEVDKDYTKGILQELDFPIPTIPGEEIE